MEKFLRGKDIIRLSQAEPVSMADEWFEIASVDHFWMTWRFKALERLIKRFGLLRNGQRFLEIGCGHGQFMLQSDSYLPVVTDGCDLNLYALEKIGDTKGDVYVYDITQQHPDMVGKYDGIFLLDVIEHIEDDVEFLSFAKKHCKPGAIVVINVPALMALHSRYDMVAGHKRRYTISDIENLFDDVGLETIYVGYWGMLLIPIAVVRKFVLRFVSPKKIIDTGFSPRSKWVNSLFKGLMSIELSLNGKIPLGTSVLAIARV